jgi:hypothetical protein
VTGNNRKVLNSHLKTAYDLGWADVSMLLGYNKVTLCSICDRCRAGSYQVTGQGGM